MTGPARLHRRTRRILAAAGWHAGLDDRGELYFVLDSLATFGRPPQALDALVLGHMPADVTEPAR